MFNSLLGTSQGHLDPVEMIDRMIEIVPADTGKFHTSCRSSSKTCLSSISPLQSLERRHRQRFDLLTNYATWTIHSAAATCVPDTRELRHRSRFESRVSIRCSQSFCTCVSGTATPRAFEIVSRAVCRGIPHAMATDATSNPDRPTL